MTAPQQGINGRLVPSPRRRVTYLRPEPLPPEFFESERARAAMGARHVQGVFAVLARMGVSRPSLATVGDLGDPRRS